MSRKFILHNNDSEKLLKNYLKKYSLNKQSGNLSFFIPNIIIDFS